MEADYGFNSFAIDGPDDEDPDYCNYEQWQYDAEEEDEEGEVEGPPPTAAAAAVPKTKTKSSNFQKQPSSWVVQRQTITIKRKSKRKRISSVEEFYGTLLQMNLKNTSSSSSSSGRTFVGHFPFFFTNKTQYFDALKEVVMEESRASIAQSLGSPPEGKLELRLLNVLDEEGDMMLLELAIVAGGLDMTRPGWVFKLCPTTHTSYRGAFGQNNHHSKHNHSNHHSKHSNHNNHHMDLETIAVVAQGILLHNHSVSNLT